MGVSKSILNYVIFCHQEELNWPFDQGKTLKDRFDEIFDSARFNKALETILKLQKDLQLDIKTLKAEQQTFKVLVSEVEDKEKKLTEHKKRLDTSKEKISDIDKQLEPVKQKIEEAQQFHTEYKNVQTEEGKLNKNSLNIDKGKTFSFFQRKKRWNTICTGIGTEN